MPAWQAGLLIYNGSLHRCGRSKLSIPNQRLGCYQEAETDRNTFAAISLWGKLRGLHACGATFPIHLATTISVAKRFVFKIAIEKEGLPRGSPAGLGAGGPRFKSGRPDQNITPMSQAAHTAISFA